ncbi:ABC transporter permease [Novosphingobium sp.]|uniref:ABC transporter permease n=1 Tax=Novosphingobium sp. TaxID=1874826 RepID=UPI0025FC77E7|nr:ABC transporter permease [Novosphingobium sp.]MCC6924650.1 ABC transporter permease [Novosphingobium sp.]
MSGTSLARGFRVEANVVGALILRELHTRFGRANIGFLWIFGEPLLLAIAVGALHSAQQLPLTGAARSVPFAIGGYALFIMFRSMVSRAETLLEANRPLLNHRFVTLFDMLLARALLDLGSTIAVLALLLPLAWLVGYADLPEQPLLVLAATVLIGWFSFALSMVVMAVSHESAFAGRLVHPLLYLSMPLSGAFFSVQWFSPGVQAALGWVPTVPIFELLRMGLFAGYPADHAELAWPVTCCALLTLLGLAGLRAVRPRIEIN